MITTSNQQWCSTQACFYRSFHIPRCV